MYFFAIKMVAGRFDFLAHWNSSSVLSIECKPVAADSVIYSYSKIEQIRLQESQTVRSLEKPFDSIDVQIYV
jgi:hypothetical protein